MKLLFVNRRSLLLFLSFLVFSFTVKADPGAEEVSTKVLQQFASSFNAATNVTWKVTKEFSKASFTANNKKTEVFYNRRNRLMGTAVYITLQELPADGAGNISREYAKYQPSCAVQYTNSQGDISYFVQLENDSQKIIVQVDDEGKLDCVKQERR